MFASGLLRAAGARPGMSASCATGDGTAAARGGAAAVARLVPTGARPRCELAVRPALLLQDVWAAARSRTAAQRRVLCGSATADARRAPGATHHRDSRSDSRRDPCSGWVVAWRARTLTTARRVDVGSRVDYVGFLTAICEVDLVDIRPLGVNSRPAGGPLFRPALPAALFSGTPSVRPRHEHDPSQGVKTTGRIRGPRTGKSTSVHPAARGVDRREARRPEPPEQQQARRARTCSETLRSTANTSTARPNSVETAMRAGRSSAPTKARTSDAGGGRAARSQLAQRRSRFRHPRRAPGWEEVRPSGRPCQARVSEGTPVCAGRTEWFGRVPRLGRLVAYSPPRSALRPTLRRSRHRGPSSRSRRRESAFAGSRRRLWLG